MGLSLSWLMSNLLLYWNSSYNSILSKLWSIGETQSQPERLPTRRDTGGVTADPQARMESSLRNKWLGIYLYHQSENGTSHLLANNLTCPAARLVIWGSEITSPLCRVDMGVKGDGTHPNAWLSQPRSYCVTHVFAQFFVQLLLLLLLMTSTGWTAGPDKKITDLFSTFQFVFLFEIWRADTRMPCHDVPASFSWTSRLGQELQCISLYLYFQYFWTFNTIRTYSRIQILFFKVKMWVFFHISVCWITLDAKLAQQTLMWCKQLSAESLKINIRSAYVTKKKSYAFNGKTALRLTDSWDPTIVGCNGLENTK